jgi:hypothetical protein
MQKKTQHLTMKLGEEWSEEGKGLSFVLLTIANNVIPPIHPWLASRGFFSSWENTLFWLNGHYVPAMTSSYTGKWATHPLRRTRISSIPRTKNARPQELETKNDHVEMKNWGYLSVPISSGWVGG